ncbi:MAG: OmpH family outer membrane protein [Rikenellaceae bacterium]|nr:OmpH family outer membrane protein [Rikenellaceae bacterium]
MKRIILTAMFALATLGIASAQKYCVIDSEKVFKSLDEYNKAMTTLDELGKSYQAEVDSKYKSIESLYNNYMQQKASLAASTRASVEQQILQKEEEAQKYQQELFGEDGKLMQKRIELIKPIQTKVFAAIEAYAKANGYDLVLDKASNASMLYVNDAIDHTAQVIEQLKK